MKFYVSSFATNRFVVVVVAGGENGISLNFFHSLAFRLLFPFLTHPCVLVLGKIFHLKFDLSSFLFQKNYQQLHNHHHLSLLSLCVCWMMKNASQPAQKLQSVIYLRAYLRSIQCRKQSQRVIKNEHYEIGSLHNLQCLLVLWMGE